MMFDKYYHYIAKIYDSLRQDKGKPLYLSTKKGLSFENTLCKPYMSVPNGGSSSITPISSQCSVSSLKFDVVNVGYEISKWFYERLNNGNSMMYGEMVDVYAVSNTGETSLIYRGLIRDVSNDNFESKYTFEIADFQERLKSSVFDRELSEYNEETISDINTYRLPYIMVNGERKGFSIKEVDEGKTNDNGEKILTRVITFEGHVIDFIEMIFKMIFSTPELAVQVPYLTNKYYDFVDLESLKSIREALSRPTYNFYFEFREPISSPYEFLIENIYKPCAIFPYLNLDGKLGLKLHKQPAIGTHGITLSENNIISLDEKIITNENITNNIIVKYDKDFKEDKEYSKRYFSSIASFNKFRMLIPSTPSEYIISGVNKLSETDKATFTATLADSIFNRYGSTGIELKITIPLEIGVRHKVGDYLFIIHRTLVVWEGEMSGTTGVGYDSSPEEETDKYNGIAHLDVKHDWGGFISNNTLGKAIDGTWIVDTTMKEISHKIFNSREIRSCMTNHELIKQWLTEEGIDISGV